MRCPLAMRPSRVSWPSCPPPAGYCNSQGARHTVTWGGRHSTQESTAKTKGKECGSGREGRTRRRYKGEKKRERRQESKDGLRLINLKTLSRIQTPPHIPIHISGLCLFSPNYVHPFIYSFINIIECHICAVLGYRHESSRQMPAFMESRQTTVKYVNEI